MIASSGDWNGDLIVSRMAEWRDRASPGVVIREISMK